VVRAFSGDVELIGYSEAARYLGMTVANLRQLVTERRVPYEPMGHAALFSRSALAVWRQRQRADPSA